MVHNKKPSDFTGKFSYAAICYSLAGSCSELLIAYEDLHSWELAAEHLGLPDIYFFRRADLEICNRLLTLKK